MSSFNANWINQYVSKKNNVVIFDIGAHNFTDSINFKRSFPNATVYAFEADKTNVEKYGKNAECFGVKVVNLAVSDEDGEATFYNSETLDGNEWTCSGSLMKPVTKNGTKEGIHAGLLYNIDGYKVKTIKFETFCSENKVSPNVVHIDVQGAEKKVMSAIGKYRPEIVFAETCEFDVYETNTSLKEFDDLMIGLGYEIKERLLYDTLYVKNDNNMKFYSQHKQDEYIYNNFFKNKKDGIFLEIGAYDGIALSNTYFFEKELGWKGICIEPQQKQYELLVKNRECICINGCVADFTGNGLFLEIDGYSTMLSGLVNKYDVNHLKRIDYEISKFGGSKKEVDVKCYLLSDLLNENSIKKIDFCSIDVEGAELDILKTIDFKSFDFDTFSIENNTGTSDIKNFMKQKGYEIVKILGCDEVYRKETYNPFAR
jgi:FkbM family methyltransferase